MRAPCCPLTLAYFSHRAPRGHNDHPFRELGQARSAGMAFFVAIHASDFLSLSANGPTIVRFRSGRRREDRLDLRLRFPPRGNLDSEKDSILQAVGKRLAEAIHGRFVHRSMTEVVDLCSHDATPGVHAVEKGQDGSFSTPFQSW